MSPELLSGILALSTYGTYEYGKDLPFHYITQTDHAICHWMNGTFCGRISYIVMAIIVYTLYIISTKALSVPVQNALQDPPKNGIAGLGIGATIATVSIFLNVLFGFIELKGIDYKKLALIPIIVTGMVMTGFTEELVFRALPINALRPYVSEHILVLGTALLFGYVHAGYSLYYGVSALIAGLLLGYGFLKYGLYWAAGLHTAFNTVETSFYTVFQYKVKNAFLAGERKTPDDDGLTSAFVEGLALLALKYTGYL